MSEEAKVRGVIVETSFPGGVYLRSDDYEDEVLMLCLGYTNDLLAHERPDFFPAFTKASKCEIPLKVDL